MEKVDEWTVSEWRQFSWRAKKIKTSKKQLIKKKKYRGTTRMMDLEGAESSQGRGSFLFFKEELKM